MPQGASSLSEQEFGRARRGFVRDEASRAQRRHTYVQVAHSLTYLEYFY
jgi:hypothetical protein